MPALRTAHRPTEVLAATDRSGHAGARIENGTAPDARGPGPRRPAGDKDASLGSNPARLYVPLLSRMYPAAAERRADARRDVLCALKAFGFGPLELEDVGTLADQLFTNALIHHEVQPGEQIGVIVREGAEPTGTWIRISVSDAGRGAIRRLDSPQNQAADAEGRRGLSLVRGLGVRLTENKLQRGYQVTASLPQDLAVRARVCRCDCIGFRHANWRACRRVLEPGESPQVHGRDGAAPEGVCSPCREYVAVFLSRPRAGRAVVATRS